MPSMWRLMLGWLKLKLSMVTLTGLGFLGPQQARQQVLRTSWRDFANLAIPWEAAQ